MILCDKRFAISVQHAFQATGAAFGTLWDGFGTDFIHKWINVDGLGTGGMDFTGG